MWIVSFSFLCIVSCQEAGNKLIYFYTAVKFIQKKGCDHTATRQMMLMMHPLTEAVKLENGMIITVAAITIPTIP